MMYEEFTRRCSDLGIEKPTFEEYSDVIEPIYNYHPMFDGNFAKDRCAELYKAGGLGVFLGMREDAEKAKTMEKECQKKRDAFAESVRKRVQLEQQLRALQKAEAAADAELQKAMGEMSAWRESVRKMWRCA